MQGTARGCIPQVVLQPQPEQDALDGHQNDNRIGVHAPPAQVHDQDRDLRRGVARADAGEHRVGLRVSVRSPTDTVGTGLLHG